MPRSSAARRARACIRSTTVRDAAASWLRASSSSLRSAAVKRVLHNLLTNALRHTPSDGAIAVVVSARPQAVTVAVEDSGVGLTDETVERMFERFWRADPARSADGSGLGLAIAQGLVEAQGGRIWAENRPEGGARVAFTLQRA